MELHNLQQNVKKFCDQSGIKLSPEHAALDAMSELGEVAKEILKMSNYGKTPIQYRDEIKMELGDLFYSLITIANSFDVNMEEALNMVIKKYEKRLQKGTIGSESE